MRELLNAFLTDAASPEMKDVVNDAIDAIDTFDPPDYEQAYLQLLMVEDDVDQAEKLQQILAMVRAHQDTVLAEHGIVMDETCRMAQATDYINALEVLASYEDKRTLAATLALDANTHEIYAELMQLVTPYTAEETMTVIESVSPSFVERIKEIANEDVQDQDEALSVQAQEKYAQALKQFMTFVGNPNLKVVQLIKDGSLLGQPFAYYAEQISHDFEVMTVDNTAAELIACALASSDGIDNPRVVIKKQLEKLIMTMDKITHVDIRVGELLLGLQVK